mgnify:CR=1 FL=1
MTLYIASTTLHEATGGHSAFPTGLGDPIVQAVQQIAADELSELLSKHETDPDNLDLSLIHI